MLLQQNKDIYASEIDSEICLFNPSTAEYLALNDTASFIWELLENKVKLEYLYKKIEESYELKSDSYQKSIDSFIEIALDKSLLKKFDG